MSAPRRIPLQPWMTAPETRAVIAALTTGDGDLRFVGGCLRDALAGRPVKDVDFATPMAPEEVMRRLERADIKVLTFGLSHGTVAAVVDHHMFEITTLREDVETDGRRAVVRFTDDWEADAARRDFTFNAMSCSVDGLLYDPFGGLADLEAGRVRFVGAARDRIREDYLRLLRFFRFMADYGHGGPDPDGLAAARELAPELTRLSGERLRNELFRLLTAAHPLPIVRLMLAENVLSAVLPDLRNPDAFAGLLKIETELGLTPEPLLHLAALLDPSADVAHLQTLADRLRFSVAARNRLLALETAPPFVLAEADLDGCDVRHALRRALYKGGMQSLRDRFLVAEARRGAPARIDLLRRLLAAMTTLMPPPFPLKGRDLLDRGVPPGPGLGDLISELEDWWLAAEPLPDRAACLVELERRLSKVV